MNIIKKCYECGKDLKFWEGYNHPVLGRGTLVCSKCFKSVAESMEKYRNFILSELKQEESDGKENILDIKSKFFKWWNNLKITH